MAETTLPSGFNLDCFWKSHCLDTLLHEAVGLRGTTTKPQGPQISAWTEHRKLMMAGFENEHQKQETNRTCKLLALITRSMSLALRLH